MVVVVVVFEENYAAGLLSSAHFAFLILLFWSWQLGLSTANIWGIAKQKHKIPQVMGLIFGEIWQFAPPDFDF